MKEIKNATIESVTIEIEDHGILTGFVHLKYGGGSGQGFGGYDLRTNNRLAQWVLGLVEVFGVGDIQDLKGKPCRAWIEDGLVRQLGHFTDERWFAPRKLWG